MFFTFMWPHPEYVVVLEDISYIAYGIEVFDLAQYAIKLKILL